MLTRTQHPARIGGTLVASLVLLLSTLTGAPPALAEGDAECTGGFCVVKGEIPGGPGGGGGDLTQPVVDPGAAEPTSNYCQQGPGSGPLKCSQNYDPALDCIWRMMNPQLPPPPGADPSRGAWEECVPEMHLRGGSGDDLMWPGSPGQGAAGSYPQRWWERPLGPEGQADPEQAARQVVAQMDLKGIEIGMVPRSVASDPNAMGAVGLPAWMWVANAGDPQAWGPYTVTRVVAGLEVTATARPTHVTWDMGNGTRVVCRTMGTPYQERYGREESPSCGHTYKKTGQYTVTALTSWQVEWSAGGESGVLQTITRSSQPVLIGELQAVNVTPRG
ncbi:PKD domain-containing protein [Micrococcus luteus]|uniref:PKD domain-containing protein n=1 Tax=Micrococcus luteus TaxID=1270 RepID=UPI002303C2C5|nr:hypothetical protein [Micrococcus luteus]